MQVKLFEQGIIFRQDKNRLTAILLSPFYSFWPRFEIRRAGCPIGLELIASELVAKGFNVIFVDACMSAYGQYTRQEDGTIRYGLTNEQLQRVLAEFNPQVVGISSLFSNQCDNVETTAAIVRQVYPRAIIVEGGGHATGNLKEVLQSPNVDMVVRREGLVSFTKLCSSIEIGETTRSFTPIEGVSYKNEDGQLTENPNQPFIQNLDVLAPRNLEIPLHPMYKTPEHTGGSRYTQEGSLVYALTSEGCPHNCRFCQIPGIAGSIRYFSLEHFESDVARLQKAGVREVVIEDDMLFADVPRALQIAQILNKYGMKWFEEGGLSMFKFMKPGAHGLNYEKMLDCLAENGCYRFYLAIESANPQSLIMSHKSHINTQAEIAEDIVRKTASVGIQGVGGFILGFKGPGHEETREDMERTVAYAKRLKEAGLAYVMLFLHTALVGTETYEYLCPFLEKRFTSHERAGYPVGGLTTKQLTELRIQWMREVNGPTCMGVAEQTKNWGL